MELEKLKKDLCAYLLMLKKRHLFVYYKSFPNLLKSLNETILSHVWQFLILYLEPITWYNTKGAAALIELAINAVLIPFEWWYVYMRWSLCSGFFIILFFNLQLCEECTVGDNLQVLGLLSKKHEVALS